jgi:DNA-binding transcriptional LysR family regulator
MNLRQLEVFEAVMRTGSLSGAARALSVSQPAVSKSLRLAEQAAGMVLFRRVKGRLFPSPEAEALLPEVVRMRGGLEAMSALVRQLREGTAGNVIVASVGSVAHPFITPAIARFMRTQPNISVEALIFPTDVVADRVARSQADFGLVHQPTDSPFLNGEVICEAEGICVLPKKHALAERKTLSARDLQKERLICYREDTAVGTLVRRALAEVGEGRGERRGVDIVINQSSQALDLVEAGAGVAVMDPFLLLGAPRASLVGVPFRPLIPNRLRIIRARERPRSRAAAQLERLVRDVVLEKVAASPLAKLVKSQIS